MMTSYN